MLPCGPSLAPVESIQRYGYAWLRERIPPATCEAAARAIESDLGVKVDAGEAYQEEPVERLEERTAHSLSAIRDWVVENVLRGDLGARDACVPAAWTDTLYGRVKRENFHTPWHCDALNTIFERGLLRKDSLHDVDVDASQWDEIYATNRVDALPWHEVPIYTFWIALRPIEHRTASHLRIHAGSHVLPAIALRERKREKALDVINPVATNSNQQKQQHDRAYATVQLVASEGYRYNAKAFVGPAFPKPGYSVGDIVIFHCFTMHEANAHRASRSTSTKASSSANGVSSKPSSSSFLPQSRISMDGRVFMRLPLVAVEGNPKAQQEKHTSPVGADRFKRRKQQS